MEALSGQIVPISQAASITGYSIPTIRKWIREGSVIAIGPPNAYRVCLGDFFQVKPKPAYLQRTSQLTIERNRKQALKKTLPLPTEPDEAESAGPIDG